MKVYMNSGYFWVVEMISFKIVCFWLTYTFYF
jgi:hypothetical protein